MKLTDKIHQLRIDFEIAVTPEVKIPRFVNALIILGEKITLIDTGVKGSEDKIFDFIRQNGRDIADIQTIILSHSHPDHIGSAAKIKGLTGCIIMAHPAEKSWIENIDIQNNERPVPGFYNLVDSSVQIDEKLSDNQILALADGLSAKVIHSPGHSAGSINILFRENRILFTADSIPLKNDIPNYDNYRDLLNSLNAIRLNSGYDTLLSSWAPAMSGREEIDRIIAEGEAYILRIDRAVKENYKEKSEEVDAACKNTVQSLGMPSFLANSVVNRAFLSHL